MSTNQAQVLSGTPVNVNPTPTELVTPLDVTKPSLFSVTLQNGDPAQTLDAWYEAAPTSSGPWSQLTATGLQQIAPLGSRPDILDVTGRQWLRVVGVSSGVGLTATVWAWKVDR